MLDASAAPPIAYFLNVALVPDDSGRVTRTIASSAPPTSFQLVILPVNMSVSCCVVRSLTPPAVTLLLTIGAIVTTHTLWSTSADAFAASSFSAASTSELPILTVPSDTCLSPSPEPPASIVMFTSGYFSLNASAASSTSGLSADEPAAVMLPVSSSALAAPLPAALPSSEAAELPHAVSAPATIITDSDAHNNFLSLIFFSSILYKQKSHARDCLIYFSLHDLIYYLFVKSQTTNL